MMKTIRVMLRLIPHVSIIISGMLIVFFYIDRVNSAMGFMENDVTKMLILILSITSITTSILAAFYRRRAEERRRVEAGQ
jgi:hypothetical protein